MSAITLNATDHETYALLQRLAGPHGEVRHATRTIAAKLRITIRAAQLRLSRIIGLGLLRRVWDFTLRSRRRLVLVTPPEAPDERNSDPPNCAHEQPDFALTTIPPLDPPVGVSGDKGIRGGGWCHAGTGGGACEGPPEPPPPPLDSLDPHEQQTPSEAPRKATAAEVAALERLAAVALPDDGRAAAAQFARYLARQHTLSRTVAGLRRLRERVAEGGVRHRRSLLLRIIADYAVEGVPERFMGPVTEAEIAGEPAPAAAIVAVDPERLRALIEAEERESAARRAADEEARRRKAEAAARVARGKAAWESLSEPERAAIRSRVEAAHPGLRRFAPMILQLCHEAAGGEA